MNILFIDTSSMILTVGAVRGAKVISRSVDAGQKGHTGILLSVIDDVLKKSALDVNDVEAVALVVGPGSFTGIRIGAATATAIAQAVGAKRISVTAFDVLAYDVPDGTALCVIDARHGAYYVREYEKFLPTGEGRFVQTEEYEKLCAEHAVAAATAVPHLKYLCDVTRGLRAAIEAKAAECTDDLGALAPLYIRKSQAEEGR